VVAGPGCFLGLAMSRAFGDFCLKSHGLICKLEVYYRKLTEKDEFLVLATDGVEERSAVVLQMIRFINPFYD
jgi:serine/threonine protein phosphatase PrpC